ncbi:MAG: RES domain-containing protein [Mariprofundus sp.]
MISAWRIVRADYAASAMNGDGAMRYGGRWNSPGTRLVYLAETRALAALEIIAHAADVQMGAPELFRFDSRLC